MADDIVRPEVYVDEDGVINVWLTPDQPEPIVMTQRDWALLTIEVDTELSMRRMDLSERRRYEWEFDLDAELEPDWEDAALACAEGLELMNEDRARWGMDTWPPEPGEVREVDHQIRIVENGRRIIPETILEGLEY